MHKEFDGQRISKRYRLPVRVSVAIIILFLPLAESLNSLKLISITTGLVALVLSVDVYGSTSMYENFWKCTNSCKYTAECPVKRRLLVDAVKNGTTIKMEEVNMGSGEKGEKGFYDVSFSAENLVSEDY